MQCTLDSCPKPAEYTFVWPWGADGACCQGHVVVVQQKARALRGHFGQVSFARLNPDRPKELSRDERVELHTARLVAESERDDARKRSGELFEVNTRLANEVRTHKVRSEQLHGQTLELLQRVDALTRERDEALTLAGKRREDVEHDLMQQVEVLVSERTSELEGRLRLCDDGRLAALREVEAANRALADYRSRDTPAPTVGPDGPHVVE